MSDGGKGSSRRPTDETAYGDNYDKIFGRKKREEALEELARISEELGLYELKKPIKQ